MNSSANIEKALKVKIEQNGPTDFVLRLADQQLETHKKILAEESRFFETMFQSESTDKRAEHFDLAQNIRLEVVKIVLQFCYLKNISSSQARYIPDILRLSSTWQMDRLLEKISINSRLFITLDNCIELMQVSQQENLTDLCESSSHYILMNSEKITIRCGLDNAQMIDLEERLKRRFKNMFPNLYMFPNYITRRGVEDGHSFELLNPLTREWSRRLVMEKLVKRRDFGIAAVGRFIYMIGGTLYEDSPELYHQWTSKPTLCAFQRDKPDWLVGGSVSVMRYDTQEGLWHNDVADLPRPRYALGAVVIDGCIYVLGGQDGYQLLDTIEKYDPQKDSWTTIKPKGAPKRSNCVVVAKDRSIYMTGGYAEDGFYRNSQACFKYDIGANIWFCVESPDPSTDLSVSCGRLYAINNVGGKVQAYNMAKNCWIPAPGLFVKQALVTKRQRTNPTVRQCQSVNLYGSILALSYSLQNDDYRLEFFDPYARSWECENTKNFRQLKGFRIVLC